MTLLQTLSTGNDTLADSLATLETGSSDIGLLDLLIQGGYMMIPLYILFVVAIFIFIERMITLKKASKTPHAMVHQVKMLVQSGNIQQARMICQGEDTPISNMIATGLERIGNLLRNIEVASANVANIQIYKREKHLSLLAAISGAAPIIGCWGTVTGVSQARIAIAQEQGSGCPERLSSGIYEAMITTA